MAFSEVDVKCINTIRTLAVDITTKSKSGHPGAPMGMAPVSHVLFNKFMKFNPKNPRWMNRDRFILSNGHACVLQYTLLHLFGYPMSMKDLQEFRQLGSATPGHPESHETAGIEVTTGPLGQGVANAVGLAMGQAHLGATFNKPGYNVIDNFTYCFFGDGCMMEGVASEAMSLAGHLQLGNLICVYDDNHISIDGDINCAFTEDVMMRLESYGWHTVVVGDGDNDLNSIEEALAECKKVTDKPSCIKLRTTIGYGSKLEGTHGVHGNPLKGDDAEQVKEKFGFNPKENFHVPQEVYDYYHNTAAQGAKAEEEWNAMFAKYAQEYPELAKEFTRRAEQKLPEGWEKSLPTYTTSDPAIASRKLSENVLTALSDVLPELVGGSADLTGSNLTRWGKAIDFQPPSTGLGEYSGRYIRYGVREHAMAAIMNGLSAYSGIIPYGGTFLNFVSYAAGAIRLSALSQLRAIHVATHDSIGLGEDGPTHQPIETAAHFRALPNCMFWRPADGNETSAAYYCALTAKETPSIIALSRQNLPQLEGSVIQKSVRGGYTLIDPEDGKADVIIVSTGSEVCICVDAVKVLKEQGLKARIVSLPCWEVFDQQDEEYQLSVFPDGAPILSVEAYSTLGWQKYSHEQHGINGFGASGPYLDVYKKFELTPEGVAEKAKATVEFWKGVSPIRSPLRRAFEQKNVHTLVGVHH
ncbi:Transketolase [Saitoella coloradoensis]